METRKDKIIEILNNNAFYHSDAEHIISQYKYIPEIYIEIIADAILAIPLDMPSEEEINKYLFEVWLGREDKVDITFNNGVVNGIRWFKEQVERRNQIVSNDFDLPKQDEYRNLDKDKYK